MTTKNEFACGLFNVEFTEEPEMDYLAHLTEEEAGMLKAKFEEAEIPCRVEPAHATDFAGILEVLDAFIADSE